MSLALGILSWLACVQWTDSAWKKGPQKLHMICMISEVAILCTVMFENEGGMRLDLTWSTPLNFETKKNLDILFAKDRVAYE